MEASPVSPSMSTHTRSIPMVWWAHLAALTLIAVELSWLTPWYRTLLQVSYVAAPARVAEVLGAVMLAAYILAYALERLRLLNSLQRAAMIVLFAACLILGERLLLISGVVSVVNGLVNLDPGAVLVLFAIAWAWWRGVYLGRATIRPLTAWRRFSLGLVLLIAHVFIVTRMGMPSVGLFEFGLFLLFGLLSMVFSRIAYVGVSHGVTRNPFDRRWLAGISLVVTLAVGFALTLGSLVTGQSDQLFSQTAEALRLLLSVLIFLLSVPGLILTYLIGPLLPILMRWLASRPAAPAPTLDPYLGPDALRNLPNNPVRPLTHQAEIAIFWILVLIILGALFLTRRQSLRKRWESSDESESLLERGDLLRMIRNAFGNRAQEMAGRLRPAQRALAAARVRRIYGELLELSEDLKRPRKAAQTPLEFLPVLGELFPAQIGKLELITETYDKVRYGSLPETQAEVDAIEAAWKEISAEGRRLKKAGEGELKTVEADYTRRTQV